MKLSCLGFGLVFLLLALTSPVAAQISSVRYTYTISGYVLDRVNTNPLPGAFVQVIFQNELVVSGYSGNKGNFALTTTRRISSFQVQISLSGYETFTSNVYKVDSSRSYNVGRILLNRSPVRDEPPADRAPSTDRPPPSQPIPATKEEVVKDHFRTNDILPTNGAYELLYALNPDLRYRKEVPANYRIITPDFPPFRETKRQFNDRFKSDKNKQEPYISGQFQNKEWNGAAIEKNEFERRSFFLSNVFAPVSYQPSSNNINHHTIKYNDGYTMYFGPKKFVFVIWKYGPNGKPITEGPDVEGKYKVIYFTDRSRNVASNASYGYAPMNDAKYSIEVYEQSSGNRLRVSDDVIDPRVYFERNDIFFLFNISWIRIPIQVYE